jgi:hypothetical protein
VGRALGETHSNFGAELAASKTPPLSDAAEQPKEGSQLRAKGFLPLVKSLSSLTAGAFLRKVLTIDFLEAWKSPQQERGKGVCIAEDGDAVHELVLSILHLVEEVVVEIKSFEFTWSAHKQRSQESLQRAKLVKRNVEVHQTGTPM